jgi:hypothetical protein
MQQSALIVASRIAHLLRRLYDGTTGHLLNHRVGTDEEI